MHIEFTNGDTLPVHNIFGGKETILGQIRDVLTLEFDPALTTMDELKQHFTDADKIKCLMTIEEIEVEEDGELKPQKQCTPLGQDYIIFLSVSSERREIPGRLAYSHHCKPKK